MPTRLVAVLFGIGMAALGAAFSLDPDWHHPARLLAGLAAVLAVLTGIRRHDPLRAAVMRRR